MKVRSVIFASAMLALGGVCPATALAQAFPQKFNTEMVKALNSADVRQRFATLGIDIIAGSSEQFAQVMRAERQSYAKLIRDTGVRVD